MNLFSRGLKNTYKINISLLKFWIFSYCIFIVFPDYKFKNSKDPKSKWINFIAQGRKETLFNTNNNETEIIEI